MTRTMNAYAARLGSSLIGRTIFLLIVASLAPAALSAQSLTDMIDADGTIKRGGTTVGNISAEGWEMTIDPDGTPRFHRAGEAAASSFMPPQHDDDIHWDGRFGTTGLVGEINVVTIAGCDEVYVGGAFEQIGGVTARNIARWDGASWHPLIDGDQNGVDGPVYAITVDHVNDQLYVGGRFDSAGTKLVNNVASYSRSQGFLPLGRGVDAWDEWFLPAYGTVFAIAVRGDQVYVGGKFDSVANYSADPTEPQMYARNIAVYTLGSWSPMGAGLIGDQSGQPTDNGAVYDIAFGVDGIYAGGRFVASGTTPITALAKWNGLAWAAVGGGVVSDQPKGTVYSVVAKGGEIYVGGDFDRVAGQTANNIAVWASTLDRWFLFGEGSRSTVYDIAVDGGRVYASGSFTGADELDLNEIAVWEGIAWEPIGRAARNGVDSVVKSIAAADGEVYVAGGFKTAGPVAAAGLALFDVRMQSWTPLNRRSASFGGVNGPVYAVALTPEYLYVGGQFSSVGPVLTNSLARWNRATGSWSPLGGGIALDPSIPTSRLPSIRAIAVDDSIVYVAGRFDFAGGVRANNVARWAGQVYGTGWTALGEGIGPNAQGGAYDSVSTVFAIAAREGMVYVGGEFILAGGEQANRIAKWDDVRREWESLGGGIGGSSFNTRVNAITIRGNDVYVGGTFPTAGDERAANIARFDGTSWQALGKGVNNAVYALTVDNFGRLFAGGDFTTAGGQPAQYIAQWDGSSWSSVGSGFSSAVFALDASPNGVYAGGRFRIAGAELTNNIARWDGSSWQTLGSGVQGDELGTPSVFSIAVDGDDVFLGGRFTVAGGESSLNIAHYTKPGGRTDRPTDGPHTPNGISAAPVAGDAAHGLLTLGAIAPNPAVTDATLTVTLGRAGTVEVRLFSTLGVEIARPFSGALTAGSHALPLSLEGLPRGVYLVRVVSEEGTVEGRVVVGE